MTQPLTLFTTVKRTKLKITRQGSLWKCELVRNKKIWQASRDIELAISGCLLTRDSFRTFKKKFPNSKVA